MRKKNSNSKLWLIVVGVILLIVIIFVASCKVIVIKSTNYNYYSSTIPNQDSSLVLIGFPKGIAHDRLKEGISTFHQVYGSAFEIVEIKNWGELRDIDGLAEKMLHSSLLISGDDGTDWHIEEYTSRMDTNNVYRAFNQLVAIQDTTAILKTLKLNMLQGDLQVHVRLRDKRTNREYQSWNSISEDGKRISGIFFLTTVTTENNITFSIRPNTNCPVKTIATYIFTGWPKISVEVCVRAYCDHIQGGKNIKDSIFDCRVTEIEPNIGPFCDFKIIPDPEKNPNPKGEITQEGCVARFAWAYVTGFKKLKVDNKAAGKFEIEGIIGRSAKGSFQVCDRCGSDPTICR